MPSPEYRDKVFSFADLYFQQTGKVPSQRMIVQACGGSYRDIGALLAQWRSETPATDGADIDFPIAAELEADIQGSIKRWMRRLVSQVEDGIRSDRLESAEARIAELEAELTDYQRLRGQMQGTTETINALRQHLEATIRENERLAHYGPQVVEVEAISNERDLLEHHLKQQTEEINRLQQQLAHQREQIEALGQQVGNLTGRNTQLETEASQLRIANSAIGAKDAQIEELRSQIRHLEQRQPTRSTGLEPIEVDQNLDLIIQERESLAAQVADLTKKIEQLEQEKYLMTLRIPEENNVVANGNGHADHGQVDDSQSQDESLQLTAAQLAKRFDCAESTVKTRSRPDGNLAEWSQIKDPDGLTWHFDPVTKLYSPIFVTTKQTS